MTKALDGFINLRHQRNEPLSNNDVQMILLRYPIFCCVLSHIGLREKHRFLSLGRPSSLCGTELKATFPNSKEHKTECSLNDTIKCRHVRTPGRTAWGERVDTSIYRFMTLSEGTPKVFCRRLIPRYRNTIIVIVIIIE